MAGKLENRIGRLETQVGEQTQVITVDWSGTPENGDKDILVIEWSEND
jgi:hypothetical protein